MEPKKSKKTASSSKPRIKSPKAGAARLGKTRKATSRTKGRAKKG